MIGHKLNAERYEVMQKSVVLVKASVGQGSGVVIERTNDEGKTRVFVWTANHVVENDAEVTIVKNIRFEGHRAGEASFKAKVIGRDAKKDIALLWVDAPGSYFRAAEFAETDPIRVGTPLTHVGNVLGEFFEDSVSVGLMSQIGMNPGGNFPWELTDQYAGEAYFGSSGGPIFRTSDKDVVGIVVGGVVQSGFMQFVPVRVVEIFGEQNGLYWAIRGDWCPRDDFLRALNLKDVQIKTFSVN
jgi:S1-C subfamily serine protease